MTYVFFFAVRCAVVFSGDDGVQKKMTDAFGVFTHGTGGMK